MYTSKARCELQLLMVSFLDRIPSASFVYTGHPRTALLQGAGRSAQEGVKLVKLRVRDFFLTFPIYKQHKKRHLIDPYFLSDILELVNIARGKIDALELRALDESRSSTHRWSASYITQQRRWL